MSCRHPSNVSGKVAKATVEALEFLTGNKEREEAMYDAHVFVDAIAPILRKTRKSSLLLVARIVASADERGNVPSVERLNTLTDHIRSSIEVAATIPDETIARASHVVYFLPSLSGLQTLVAIGKIQRWLSINPHATVRTTNIDRPVHFTDKEKFHQCLRVAGIEFHTLPTQIPTTLAQIYEFVMRPALDRKIAWHETLEVDPPYHVGLVAQAHAISREEVLHLVATASNSTEGVWRGAVSQSDAAHNGQPLFFDTNVSSEDYRTVNNGHHPILELVPYNRAEFAVAVASLITALSFVSHHVSTDLAKSMRKACTE